MDAKRLRAMVLFGACLSSRTVRSATDPAAAFDTSGVDVAKAIAELKAVDCGELAIEDARAVADLMLRLGVGSERQGGSWIDALRKRCEWDGEKARRWMQAAKLIAPSLFKDATT